MNAFHLTVVDLYMHHTFHLTVVDLYMHHTFHLTVVDLYMDHTFHLTVVDLYMDQYEGELCSVIYWMKKQMLSMLTFLIKRFNDWLM